MARGMPDAMSVDTAAAPVASDKVAQIQPITGYEEIPGRAIAAAGADLGQASDQIAAAHDRFATIEAESAYNTLNQASLKLQDDPQDGFKNIKGLKAMGSEFFNTQMDRFNTTADAIQGQMTGPDAQKKFQDRALIGRLQYQSALLNHASQETEQFATGTYKATQDLGLQNIQRFWAPEQEPYFRTELARMLGTADQEGARKGQGAAEVLDAKSRIIDSAWTARISAAMDAGGDGPLIAQKMFDQVTEANLLSPEHRIVLTHQLRSATMPVEAGQDADQAVSDVVKKVSTQVQVQGQPAADDVSVVNQPVTVQPGQPIPGLTPKQSQLVMDEAIKPGRGRVDYEFANDSGPVKGSVTATNVRPSVRDIRGQYLDALAGADTLAEKRKPGDIVYRQLVEQEVHGRFSKLIAAEAGIQAQAQGTIFQMLRPGDGSAPPTTMSELQNVPGARAALDKIDPGSIFGIVSHLNQNAREAAGEFVKSKPAVVQDLFSKIMADETNPDKITSRTQLAPYFAHGLSRTDYDWLSTQIDRAQTPEGNRFMHDQQTVMSTARRMFMGAPVFTAQPDKAEDAAYRFGRDLDAQVGQYRKDGKDPRLLFDPTKPDYALAPGKMATYYGGNKAAVADQAAAIRAGSPAPAAAAPQYPTAVNPKTKETLIYKDGQWQKP